MKLILISLLILTFGGFHINAQTTNLPADKAVVYFYSLATGATLGRVKKPIFLDDKEIAEIRPAKYFIILLEPGVHNFRLRNKKFGGIETEFKAGETYYLRINWESDGILKPAGISKIEAENGAFDIKNLKPVGKDNIKNKEIVFLELKNER